MLSPIRSPDAVFLPWDEDLFWFGLEKLPEASTAEKPRNAAVVSMTSAGCHIIRDKASFVFIRAGRFVHRPSQLDMMHVDVWSGGNNIALDAGTYSYNGSGIWRDVPFARSEYHNSITVDGRGFARRLSKFLFVPWPESHTVCYAISQKNNHGVSEATALWTLGVLFPNLKRANCWREKGTKILSNLCDELIYDDGGFSQHSANYHRLLLHLLAWTMVIGRMVRLHGFVDSSRS